tara:strand:+ start:111 stop:287 length:177 start_codon:yes stop_codon:yes gene_type:complete
MINTNDTQNQIIRQSSLKASIDYLKLTDKKNIEPQDVVKIASFFGSYCATGQMPELNK